MQIFQTHWYKKTSKSKYRKKEENIKIRDSEASQQITKFHSFFFFTLMATSSAVYNDFRLLTLLFIYTYMKMAGLSVVGRDHYGVFPLRGKLLNVREASSKQIMDNEEIQNIKKILGLQQNKEYTSVKSLRYGHLMIMADQVGLFKYRSFVLLCLLLLLPRRL